VQRRCVSPLCGGVIPCESSPPSLPSRPCRGRRPRGPRRPSPLYGSIAYFAQAVLQGQLPLPMRGAHGPSVALGGCRKAGSALRQLPHTGCGRWGHASANGGAHANVRQPPASWLPPALPHHGACTHWRGEVTGKMALFFLSAEDDVH
jgi:hypothetical protein